MPRYKLTIAYDGTDFCGWQKQEPFAPGEGAARSEAEREAVGEVRREGEDRSRLLLRTVQEVVERAVREIVREPVTLKGASRTDAGVHANGQVAAFSCSGDEPPQAKAVPALVSPSPTHPLAPSSSDPIAPAPSRESGWPLSRGIDRLVRAVNGRLPDDVLIVGCEAVAEDFDPISHCTSKGYSYTMHASRQRTLWDRRYVHQVWEPLDVYAMKEAAQHFIGEHDFAAFAAAGHGRQTTVRTIHTCDVTRPRADRLRIDVSGNGFLYNMVRIIAGTLADVGRGKIAPDDLPRIIESKDRGRAGPTFPASGLCLEWIRYREVKDGRCACGYDLKGLRGDRCPECGVKIAGQAL